MAYRSRQARITRILTVLAGLLILAGGVGAGALYVYFLQDLPDFRTIQDYRPPLASSVVDRKGRPIGAFYRERRRLVALDAVPEHVVQAFVAGEDNTFFEHEGIDFQAILRAALVNLAAGGEKRQGASTITQQMVKGLLLSPERTYRRKVRELILARRIEQRFSKQEILFLYLNQIYFGHGAYGIQEAARTYFGKDVSQLTVSEGALLAGLPKAPSRYSPFNDPDLAERRRRYVLERMHVEEYVDDTTYAEAVAAAPELTDSPWKEDYAAAAYLAEEVRRYLFDALGGDLVLEGGLVIETTIDLDLQNAAVQAVRKGLRDLDHRQGYRGVERHVEQGEIEEEIERVAVENGLAPPEPAEGAEVDDALVDEELADEEVAAAVVEAIAEVVAETQEGAEPVDEAQRVRELLPEDEPVLGVVIEVDAEAQIARVAFAPDVEAVVRLEDVSWARKANPDVRGDPVKKIARIFRVGDVARFELLPPPAEPLPEDSPARDQLRVGLHQRPVVEGALLSIEVATGDVMALVGGNDFEKSEFNRVTQARRQPGSAFKPLIYGAALSLVDEEGKRLYTPASIIHDRPKVYEDRTTGFVWRPQNYGRKFYGPITLRKALAKSVNNAAVHLADEVGVDTVMAYARQLGITSPLERSLALALGASGVSLLELTRTYAVYPNGGRRVVPRFIRRVVDREGNVLMEEVRLGDPLEPELEKGESEEAGTEARVAEQDLEGAPPTRDGAPKAPVDRDQLIPSEDAYLMADMLKAVVREGTGWRLKHLGRPLGGKTGTTNDQADAWFMGFSPDIATGVWVGHDVSHFLGWGETGSRAAAPIWVDYMRVAVANRPRRDFPTPGSIVFTRIDRETGLLASRHSEDVVFQAFIAGTEPTETADARRTTSEAEDHLRSDSFGEPAGSLRLMQLDSL